MFFYDEQFFRKLVKSDLSFAYRRSYTQTMSTNTKHKQNLSGSFSDVTCGWTDRQKQHPHYMVACTGVTMR
jgi:hypothetical protein